MALLLPLIALAAITVQVVSPRTVTLPDRALHVSDVLQGAAALPSATRRIVIARLPAAGERIALPRAALASLVRRASPGIPLVSTALTGSVTFVVPALVAAKRERPAFTAPAEPTIKRGVALHLTSIVGPVRVDRPVTALQASRGQRVFVRDADGTVFAVGVADAAGAR